LLHFNDLAGGADPCEYPDKLYAISAETRITALPEAEDRTIVSSFVWTKHRNVSDGRLQRPVLSDGQ